MTVRMPFGKYKNIFLAEIPNDYLLWLLENTTMREPLLTKVKEQVELNAGHGVTRLGTTRVVNIATTEQFDVYIGRPSKYGNPYVMNREQGNRDDVIQKFALWFFSSDARAGRLREDAKRELRGMILACYCKPLPCHGDVLADYVDGRIGEDGLPTKPAGTTTSNE